MAPKSASFEIEPAAARAIWLSAQRLDAEAPFGAGPEATRRAVEHLGYVQIDTINVVERSHHHILHTRIPAYRRADLERAQAADKSVFEYWTHALAYAPTADYRVFARAMAAFRAKPNQWFCSPDGVDYRGLLKRIRDEGALSIRDIDDDVLVETTHLWESRKPSKQALRYGFFAGDLAIARRDGMLKAYELTDRHFGWGRRPRPATDGQYADYLLTRALRSQGIVSLDSICYGDAPARKLVVPLIERAERARRLVRLHVAGRDRVPLWAEPEAIERGGAIESGRVHILSPFDPLTIQRKRLSALFGYHHRFEAYVPEGKRVLGYFALPVLVGDRIVAALDLKTDRRAQRLLIRRWTWIESESAGLKAAIQEALERFERFQLSRDEATPAEALDAEAP